MSDKEDPVVSAAAAKTPFVKAKGGSLPPFERIEPTPMSDERDQLARLLAEHDGITFDLGTPRQYTQHGGWNQDCICGFGLPDGGDGSDEACARVAAAHNQHIADVLLAAGWRPAGTVLQEAADEWKPSRWWRVLDADGSLWCETSDEEEARRTQGPGQIIQRLYSHVAAEWRDIERADAAGKGQP